MLLTIRSVQFLSLPVSLTSGEYPLLTSATQDLSSYVLAEYTMNYPVDLQLTLTAPDFALWETCNMVRINDVIGSMYWVVGAEMVTSNQKAIRFALSYCGPSSLIHKNDTAVGLFSRLPENKCPWLKRTPISDSLKHTRTVELPNLGMYDSSGLHKLFWCQVTFQETSSADKVITRRVGFFVAYGPDDMSVQVKCLKDSEGIGNYPVFSSILEDVADVFGTTASSVLDISISERSPYAYNIQTVSSDTGSVVCVNLAAEMEIGYIIPNFTANGDAYYELSDILTPYEWSKSITISDYEKGCGTITIRDESTASLGEIPTSYAGSGSSILLTIRTISDYTGITTYVGYGGYQVAIPEGHLPWNGTSWEEYRAYSLAYDRQALSNSIQYANQRVAVGIAQNAASSVQSAAMGFIGGDPVGAVAGAVGGAASFAISTWATNQENLISQRESTATQLLAERRAAGQPSTPYNSGYGLAYCFKSYFTPCAVWVEIPANLTSSIDDDYTACFGFPAEGLRSVTFGEGYYKGMLYATSKLKGPRFDKLNQTLQNGFRFKEV